jgi:hypothetical protein
MDAQFLVLLWLAYLFGKSDLYYDHTPSAVERLHDVF